MINKLKTILLTLEYINNVNSKTLINKSQFQEYHLLINKFEEIQFKIVKLSEEFQELNFANDSDMLEIFLNLQQQILSYEQFISLIPCR